MSILGSIYHALKDLHTEWDICETLVEQDLTYLSEDSLADLAGDCGAHNPRRVAEHVRDMFDRGIEEETFQQNATLSEKFKHFWGF